MSTTPQREQKNYASLRGSRAFGEKKDKIGLRFDKAEFIKWLQALPETQGFIKIIIAPRHTPSEANAFTMFEDTWKPDFKQVRKAVEAPSEPVSDKQPESDDAPF